MILFSTQLSAKPIRFKSQQIQTQNDYEYKIYKKKPNKFLTQKVN